MPRAFRHRKTLGGDNSLLYRFLPAGTSLLNILPSSTKYLGGFLRSRGMFPQLLLSLHLPVPCRVSVRDS